MNTQLVNIKNRECENHRVDARYYKEVPGRRLQLHIFYPENYDSQRAEPYEAVLFFHGGGWTQGIIEWGYGDSEFLSSLGLIGIAVEYRLANDETSAVEAMKDASSAVRWLRSHGEELNVDMQKIIAMGHSAGGHLAISTALIPHIQEEGEDQSISSVPDIVWALAPPVDLSRDPIFEGLLLGKKSQEDCSPICHMKKTDTSINIISGDMDHVIPVDTLRAFTQGMKKLGNDIRFWEYPKGGHMMFYDDPEGRAFTRDILKNEIIKENK